VDRHRPEHGRQQAGGPETLRAQGSRAGLHPLHPPGPQRRGGGAERGSGRGERGDRAALRPASDDLPALIPFDGRAKKALELTFREALRLGNDFVGTEHILLALLEVEGGTGLLSGLGVDKAAVEAVVTDYLSR
jgi:hypothetical protein